MDALPIKKGIEPMNNTRLVPVAVAAALAACAWAAPAQAGPLLDKALAYSANHQEHHAPGPFHCSVAVQFASLEDLTPVRYEKTGDSSIWTGNYLAGEAYRYAVTGDPAARLNALDAVECLLAMEQVSGKPGYVARYVGPAEPPFITGSCDPENDCFVVTDGPFAGNFWRGNTSSDQNLGWWYGLSHAYDFVLQGPEDADVRARIEAAMTRALDALIADDYLIINPDGSVSTRGPEIVGNEALAFHLAAARIVGGRFVDMLPDAYARHFVDYLLLTTYPVSRWFQYFAFHLGQMAQHTMMRYEADPFLSQVHRDVHRDRLHNELAGTQQVMFDYIAWGEQAVDFTDADLASAEAALGGFPEAPKREVRPEQGPWTPDPVVEALNFRGPILFGLFGEEWDPLDDQALEPFPPDERCIGRFRWQISPYDVCDPARSRPAFEISGGDYVVAYWMGRYYGFLSADD